MRTHIVAGLGVGLAVASCGPVVVRELDPNHCANQSGNDWCEEKYGGERSYCAWGTCGPTEGRDGCVESRPAEDECYSPCGALSTVLEDASCLGVSSSSSDSGSSTGETTEESGSSESSTTGPVPCMGNEDCPDAAAPFCEPVSGECVACDAFGAEGDAACAGLDPMAPLCVGGACVACTPENPAVCDDQLLLCDGGTNTCIQCTEHTQCGSGACELDVGRCFPDDLVVHVDGDPTAMPMPDYTSLTAAVAAVDDGMHGVIIVHELDMDASYQAALTIDGGKTIALLAAPGEAPRIQGTGGNPGLRVEGAGTVLYMDGLSLRSGDALGVVVDGAFAWVDRSRIVQNTGGGVLAQGGAELTLRNCFVGGSIDDASALEVNAASEVLYTTLGAGTVTATGLSCSAPVAVVIRNSFIVARGIDATGGFDVVCDEADITYSATETMVGGEGNEALGEMPTMMPQDWFVDFAGGDFHITTPPIAIAATARWQEGDPTTDIDGQPRPAVDATPDHAGADLP